MALGKSNIRKILITASVLDLGNPDEAGKSLADIVLFLMRRIPENKRASAVNKMIAKFRMLNAEEISMKNMRDYSCMGQSISFIKNVLAGHNVDYVRRVLDSIVRNMV